MSKNCRKIQINRMCMQNERGMDGARENERMEETRFTSFNHFGHKSIVQ